MGFSRQECWSGCHFPLQGVFWTQGSSSQLLRWQAGSLPRSHQGSLLCQRRDLWVQWQVFLLAVLTSRLWHTHIPTHLHTYAHASTHLHPPLLPLHVHVTPLSVKPSSPTNSTFISNLHSLWPQPECINCFFFYPHNIFYKTFQHFSWSINSISFSWRLTPS